jgi:hypothetical protein
VTPVCAWGLQIWLNESGWTEVAVACECHVGWHYLATTPPSRFGGQARAQSSCLITTPPMAGSVMLWRPFSRWPASWVA